MYKQEWSVGWEVREAAGRSAASRPEWQAVDLPQDLAIGKPRSQCYPTGGAGGYAWSGLATYRKRFVAPAEWRGRSVQLEFEGVYMNAEVSLNHQLLALHPYGYTSFIVDLTPHLRLGEENELRVVVNNTAQPNSRWYSGTGIYRPVWLRLGGALHIQPWGVFVTTPVATAATSTVRVLTALAGVSAGAVLRSTIVSAQGEVLASAETPITDATVEQTLDVSGVQLWSLVTPALYTLRSEVLLGVEVVDVDETTFGFREVCLDAQHGLRLNGEPLKLKGGCIHHDNGLLGAASYARAEERKVELLKASGYNAIRCAHNPPAPALLDACDRLGMLVIDESFDCWRTGKNPNDYHLYFEDWWQRDVAAMVVRDRNHPSIIAWSIGNEVPERAGLSDGYAWARRQADYIRSLDPTRPITSALPFLFEEPFQALLPKVEGDPTQNSFNVQRHVPVDAAHDIWGQLTRPFCEALDIVGYNYMHARYACDGEHFPGRVIAGTETYPWFAFESWRETERLPWVIGDFVWTAMDYLGESAIGGVAVDQPYAQFFADPWPVHLAGCGDLDLSGVKRPQSYYRDLLWGVRTAPFIAVLEPRLYGHKVAFSPWGWEPVSDSWSFPGQEGQPARVDVYALEDEVELLLNGVSLGRKPAGQAQRNKASFDVAYQPGTLEAVGYCAGQPVSRATLSSTGAPAALRLAVDRGALPAGRGEVAYVAVEIIDAQGHRVPYADLPVTLTVTGAGELLAIGSANPASEEPYVGATHCAYEGRLLAVIRSTGVAGEIVVGATAEGLSAGEARLSAR